MTYCDIGLCYGSPYTVLLKCYADLHLKVVYTKTADYQNYLCATFRDIYIKRQYFCNSQLNRPEYPHGDRRAVALERSPRDFSATGAHNRAPPDHHRSSVHDPKPERFTEKTTPEKLSSSAKVPMYGKPHVPSKPRESSKEAWAPVATCTVIVGNIPPGTSADALISFLENKRHTNIEEVKSVEMKGKKAVVTLYTASGESEFLCLKVVCFWLIVHVAIV